MQQRIRQGDLVQVTAGADRGKQGRVIAVDRDGRRVRVDKARMQKRHLRPGRKGARQGGVVDQEGFIHISNVMLVDPGDGKPSRTRRGDGEGRGRVFTRSGDPVPDSLEG